MLPSSRRNASPLPWLAAGLAALAAGLALAHAYLPEWRRLPLSPEGYYVERFEELARRAGITLDGAPPRVGLGSSGGDLEPLLAPWAGREPGSDPALGQEVLVHVSREGLLPPDGLERRLEVGFAPGGEVRRLAWTVTSVPSLFAALEAAGSEDHLAADRFAPLLLQPGERLGRPSPVLVTGNPAAVFDIAGSRPPRHLFTLSPQGSAVLKRRPGDGAWGVARAREMHLARRLLRHVPWALGSLAVVVLFVVLASRRRIDLVNGGVVAALAAASALSGVLADYPEGTALGLWAIAIGFHSLWILLLWSAGESLIRSTEPDFTTSLDALRVGRIGPRGGRALLAGFGLGAAAAGLRLALSAAAVPLPGAWPEGLSVELPVFDGFANPIARGIALAAVVVVTLAFARRLLPPRWAPWGAVAASPLVLSPVDLHPDLLQLAGTLAVVGLLVLTARRFGMTALLVAAVTTLLLPAAAFSWLHLSWLPGTFAATAGISAALLVLGFVGLGRAPEVEMGRLTPPAFMRRLDEERRVRYEMDLLARMQRGLLPERVPQPAGWEIVAHSQLATEAGGDLYDFLPDGDGHLWIAVGDVAGHGYSCSVVQAMTTAALTSLVDPGRTPSDVLHHVDRVIRRGGSRRNFTSLALLRLDPRTGQGVFANAGHPYPLLAEQGQVREIALPGLPLGHGPQRRYDDLAVHLPPGSVLVLCSDGLFEAADWSGSPYGYERPREVLGSAVRRPAQAILEALLADWRRHLGNEEPPDDTTILVLKRALG